MSRMAAQPIFLLLFSLSILWPSGTARSQTPFRLAPAVALEAEDFHVEAGWKVIPNGHGNYMVDMIGFNHISGERLLAIDSKDKSASAFADVSVPETGAYRLWVRYEYPAFCETRFRVVVEQDGHPVLDRVMGTKNSLRYGLGEPIARAQHDPSWGPEGLFAEVVSVPELKAGKARIYLKGSAQPQEPGVAANRNIDLVYLTRDTGDAWMKHYRKQTNLYPLLDAFRDSRGPRYEVRFRNRDDKAADFHITHVYNRVPWGVSEAEPVRGIAAGANSDWVPLRMQDTTHFSLVRFSGSAKTFDVEIRPIGGAAERKLSGEGTVQVYLPPYAGKGDKAITPIEELDAILAELKKTPTIGKKPTQPLCFGGWMPLGLENAYGRKYAQLYAALGFRSLHPAHSGPAVLKNLQDAGIPPSKSWAASGYRNPPTVGNIEQAKRTLARNGLKGQLRFFDYGDEIAFSEWMQLRIQVDLDKAKLTNKKVKPIEILSQLWVDWLHANRSDVPVTAYWLEKWGPFNRGRMRPDSSAAAATANPRLYVDSLLFYEDIAIHFVADGMKDVKKTLGQDVLCGANYSCHPFYYPHSTMYVKWFREGAAGLARHSEYFWQVAQAGPMINGYIAEHFRAGLRDHPNGVLRQYTMPHSPGNTEASFLRSAFTHLAHGATMLDFFGIGMNETFTENHIDHRDHARYRALRDVTHAVGLVEDLLPKARPVASPVALLLSASTERWDFAGVAQDSAGHALFGPDFRKMRLNAHMDRLGLWTALTFLGASPDLIMEEDVSAKGLQDYKVLIVVGDCLPPSLAPAIEAWVRKGGVVLATANAGRYDPYRTPTPAFEKLFGLQSRQSEERIPFFRPRQELPFLKPFDGIVCPGGVMPQLATFERIEPAKGTTVLARFKEGKGSAIVERQLGKGHVFYVAALPGVAYLWSALQPPAVPDRGPGTHSIPTAFNPGARALFQLVLKAAHVQPTVEASPSLMDTRLLKASGGYILPIANYQDKIGQAVTLRIRTDEKIGKATSAYHGNLPMKEDKGCTVLTIPSLGYGDVLRLDLAK
ncbi:MAG TPA: beta-galactosidase trimerization domain-containing protein [Gemmataceae bacterium]|nr:beta-galactosidase trimerization domain-containing protein [Gemmataceae bacterium]